MFFHSSNLIFVASLSSFRSKAEGFMMEKAMQDEKQRAVLWWSTLCRRLMLFDIP